MIITGSYVTGNTIRLVDPTPGKTYYFQPPKLSGVQINVMTAAWGIMQRGRVWFNTDTKQLQMWKGSSIVTIG